MPLIVILPLLAGGVGFAGGMFAGTSLTSVLKWGAVLGLIYFVLLKSGAFK